jgi:hypothetical protein
MHAPEQLWYEVTASNLRHRPPLNLERTNHRNRLFCSRPPRRRQIQVSGRRVQGRRSRSHATARKGRPSRGSRDLDAIEIERVVPPSGNMSIGPQTSTLSMRMVAD